MLKSWCCINLIKSYESVDIHDLTLTSNLSFRVEKSEKK